ncbi:protein of unknown function [Microbacterium sp. Nx66]|nr:protein of unknown function [Microbacterium sp. Nx66]
MDPVRAATVGHRSPFPDLPEQELAPRTVDAGGAHDHGVEELDGRALSVAQTAAAIRGGHRLDPLGHRLGAPGAVEHPGRRDEERPRGRGRQRRREAGERRAVRRHVRPGWQRHHHRVDLGQRTRERDGEVGGERLHTVRHGSVTAAEGQNLTTVPEEQWGEPGAEFPEADEEGAARRRRSGHLLHPRTSVPGDGRRLDR